MVFLLIARKVVLSFSVVLAFTILILSALLIYAHNGNNMLMESTDDNATAALAVGVSVVHMCTVTPMLVLDFVKRKTILSTVLVEAIWLWVMWIIWLSTASFATSTDNMSNWGCSSWLSPGCYEVKFLEIFCFINWIQLMIYTNTLFTLAIIGHLRGQPIWMSSIADAPILSSPLALTMPSEPQFKPGFSHSTTSMSDSQRQYPHLSIPLQYSQGYQMPSTIPPEQFLSPTSLPQQSSGSPMTPYTRESSIPEAPPIPRPTSLSTQIQPPPDAYSMLRTNQMSPDLEAGSLQHPPPSYSGQSSRAATPTAISRNHPSDSSI